VQTLQFLAAPAEAPGISGGQIFGAVTASGAALVAGTGLIIGLKGSDWGPLVINNKRRAAWWGIVTSTIWVAIALFLTCCAFGPKWGSKTAPPAVIGLAAAVVYGTAGGVWGILVNVVRMLIGIVTGQR
jgi:hypothetical protein